MKDKKISGLDGKNLEISCLKFYNVSVAKIKIISSIFAIAALLLIGTGVANAQNGGNGAKPGWGYGDKNHVHTGPSGVSVSVPPTGQ